VGSGGHQVHRRHFSAQPPQMCEPLYIAVSNTRVSPGTDDIATLGEFVCGSCAVESRENAGDAVPLTVQREQHQYFAAESHLDRALAPCVAFANSRVRLSDEETAGSARLPRHSGVLRQGRDEEPQARAPPCQGGSDTNPGIMTLSSLSAFSPPPCTCPGPQSSVCSRCGLPVCAVGDRAVSRNGGPAPWHRGFHHGLHILCESAPPYAVCVSQSSRLFRG
jgi:hypothetical protein